MNATQLLTKQHDDVDKLIAQVEAATDGRTKREIFSRLADSLAAHITIEEKLFYPAVMAARTDDKLHEAVEEHLAAKRLIADMLVLPVGDVQFDAKMSVLKEGLQHHNHHEEEGKLFPQVRKMLTTDELDALGGEMLSMFEDLMTHQPRELLPGQTKRAAELPRV